MEHIRIGNDIVIRWSIFAGDAAYDLEGRDIAFFLKTVYGRCRITDYSVEGNAIKWTFYGKDQKAECAYGLELVENDGEKGMYTVDECDAFRLVGSCHECGCGEPEEDVEVVSLDLNTRWERQYVEIVDNLESTNTNAALSANQGNVLLTRIEEDELVLKEHSDALFRLTADADTPGSIDNRIQDRLNTALKWVANR